MGFHVPESDIAAYYRDGIIVFRQILAPSLIADLRRECEKAVALARRIGGANAQRLQPLQQYEGEMNLKPFRDYAEFPPLREAVAQLLSPRHYYGELGVVGVLIEPAEVPYSTTWHRDITLRSSRLSAEEFDDLMRDWHAANQVNCALYDDDCTWYVPGSH